MSITLNGSSNDGPNFAGAINAAHDDAAFNQTTFNTYFTAKDTDDLSEGSTNLYYTTARFDTSFSLKTTDNLTIGTNKFMTSDEKTKLGGIAEGAEVNVSADWTATSGITEIQNLPSTFTPTSHTHTISEVSDVSATAAELNKLDGATVSTEELNFVKDVSSPIQTQLDNKQDDTGSWTGTKIPENKGGTDQSTYTKGDILFSNATDSLNKLGIGGAGTILKSVDGLPSWSTALTSLDALSDTSLTTPAEASLLLYDSSSWVDGVISGDATLSSSGALTLDATNSNQTGLPNLTTVGYIITGGTGFDSYAKGDILYALDADNLQRLNAGSTGALLATSASGLPSWTSSPALSAATVDETVIGGTTPAAGTFTTLIATSISADTVAGAMVDTDLSSVSGSDDTVASALAIKTYVDSQVASENELAELNDTDVVTDPPDASMLLWDTGDNKWRDKLMSGDATMTDTGVVTVGTLNQDTTGNADTATTAATALAGDSATDFFSTGTIASARIATLNQDTTGNADTATTAATVTGAAQTAITSVGTLSGLTVSGVVDLASSELTIAGSGGTVDHVLTTDGSGNISWAAAGGHYIKEESGSALTTRTNMTFIGELAEAVDNAATDSTDIFINAKASWLYG